MDLFWKFWNSWMIKKNPVIKSSHHLRKKCPQRKTEEIDFGSFASILNAIPLPYFVQSSVGTSFGHWGEKLSSLDSALSVYWAAKLKRSYLSWVLKVCANAIRRRPAVNCSCYDDYDCFRPAQINLLHNLANARGCAVVLTGDFHFSDIKVFPFPDFFSTTVSIENDNFGSCCQLLYSKGAVVYLNGLCLLATHCADLQETGGVLIMRPEFWVSIDLSCLGRFCIRGSSLTVRLIHLMICHIRFSRFIPFLCIM